MAPPASSSELVPKSSRPVPACHDGERDDAPLIHSVHSLLSEHDIDCDSPELARLLAEALHGLSWLSELEMLEIDLELTPTSLCGDKPPRILHNPSERHGDEPPWALPGTLPDPSGLPGDTAWTPPGALLATA